MPASKNPSPASSSGQDDELALENLAISDLTLADLPSIKWSGDTAHLENIRSLLERTSSGAIAYLALRNASGQPLAIGSIDYTKKPDAGRLWQLVTKPSLRNRGLGTHLISSLEQHIRQHGRSRAELAVEDDNPRALSLYERLGYQTSGHEQHSWQQTSNSGHPYTHHAQVTLLGKNLNYKK